MKINLFDVTANHLFSPQDEFLHNDWPSKIPPKNMTFVRKKMEYDGISVFGDSYMNNNIVDPATGLPYNLAAKSKYKVGWTTEHRHLGGDNSHYTEFEKWKDRYVFTMTWDQELLETYPKETRFLSTAYTFVKKHNQGIHPKDKNVSMIFSHKDTTEGHQLRHKLAALKMKNVHLYGTGLSWFPDWTDQPDRWSGSPGFPDWGAYTKPEEIGLMDYRFHVTIENIKDKNYFTEKIIDAFLTGAVPIYWGCTNIDFFFDIRGIIVVNSLQEIVDVVNSVNEDDYNRMLPYVKNNYEIAQNYIHCFDNMEKVLKELE